ncbi:MAG: aminotransferase class I/II-fold pyridoxal phosphate-dependent enzyme, partial [Candidatus Latescibacterota bacterium]
MQALSDGGEKPRPARRRIVVEKSDRFHRLSYEPGMELARHRRRAEARGLRVIDLSRLAPDLPAPVEAGPGAAPLPRDEGALRRAIAERLRRERNLALDPETEVLPLLHLPEAFRLLALAFVNPSDVVLLPDPGDPVYRASALVAGGWPIGYALPVSRGRLPDLDRIEPEAAFRARLLYTCYPNRPTGAAAPREFFEELIAFARSHNVLVANDASLAGAYLAERPLPGLLDLPGGKEVGVEFGSLAPFHDVGGWRPGYAIGNREVLFAIASIAERLGGPRLADVGEPIARALAIPAAETERARVVCRERVRLAADGIRALDWEVEEPSAGFHLWVPVPRGTHALDFARFLLRRAGILSVPGGAFGEFGEDHVLLSVSVDET